MIRQTPYSKENEQKNNSEHSANRALPPSGEPEGASGASFISHSLSLPLQSVSAVLTLLNEGCTIPFISRYRKERTGGLDEVQITDISELYDRLKELGKRKETILKTIRSQEGKDFFNLSPSFSEPFPALPLSFRRGGWEVRYLLTSISAKSFLLPMRSFIVHFKSFAICSTM